jgi:hypothetical protein
MSRESQRFRPLPAREPVTVGTKHPVGSKWSLDDIFIRCPRTRAPVATGLNTRWVVFDSLPAVGVPLRCPSSGLIHKWKPRDAWIGPRHSRGPNLYVFRNWPGASCCASHF